MIWGVDVRLRYSRRFPHMTAITVNYTDGKMMERKKILPEENLISF